MVLQYMVPHTLQICPYDQKTDSTTFVRMTKLHQDPQPAI
jgi:hypothetical protein